jgi:septal ring factor EnvC (AmiA/AmiB activator)
VDPLAPAANGIDLTRLETAVRDLTERFVAQRDEAAKLRAEVEARDRRVEELEGELRRMQQSRRDVAQRIDELIDQIGKLEGRLSTQAETP